MGNGALVISLDFELLWGVFDKVEWRDRIKYFQNTRSLIPEILRLFEDYNIHCTWATVGMLCNENWEEWNENIPDYLPEYFNKNLSAYTFGKSIQEKETEDLCFAPKLVKQIIETANQELATHTYSHYYCREDGQNADSFSADMNTAIKMARNFGVDLDSLVFPRNQLNTNYLKICSDFGIKSVRSNPETWYWKDTENDSLQQKIFRTGDAYLGKKDKPYKFSDIDCKFQVSVQPASRLLRPYTGKPLLDKLKMKRIIDEITYAARNAKVYHLWWHPHNFGNNPRKNLQDLELILKHFLDCKNKYGFQSLSMKGINNILKGV
ncbi:polysaccharide deacetylase family protein [Christiangramia sabulilitoris]|uniref:Polysaccharide deacetylase family protein n=1 Tax=Christiangramia sabulilitoris TaxID=2583991 RepID=A0A550I2A0_9FLAO|nr:polysaccharide deacetylase family protein [Christiangramia sabulilitoris]TRO65104.1 polysaccharide deacetylase family protein [Christiangramia sabulilitoris]